MNTQGRAFAAGIFLNVAFVAIEAAYGIAAGSVALVADATHNLGDVLALALAWAAVVLARRKPTRQRTYGLRKTTVLAALANALLLLVAVGGIGWEAVGRLLLGHPLASNPSQGRVIIVVAAIGVAINALGAMFLFGWRRRDANLRGAFLHLASDAAVSLGVTITGAVILKTGWMWLDPAISIAVSGVILIGTWRLLKQSVNLALDAVPQDIDAGRVHDYLSSLPGVLDVHDLHIWAMSTTETALTAHLVMEEERESSLSLSLSDSKLLGEVGKALREKFNLEHSTLQLESRSASSSCRQARDGSV